MARPYKAPRIKAKYRKPKNVKGKTRGFITIFKQEAVLAADAINVAMAKAIAKGVKDVIRNQKYNWAPLSESWADRKDYLELDPRTLIASGAYLKAIGWWKSAGGVHVGVRPNKLHPGHPIEPGGEPEPKFWRGEQLTIRQIARWLEFGTRKMPARPVWRPFLANFLKQRPGYRRRYHALVLTNMAKRAVGLGGGKAKRKVKRKVKRKARRKPAKKTG
jgi:hypothetical protein